MEFGYQLLRGRGGASGLLRSAGDRTTVSIRGVTPGDECALYALREGRAALLALERADREGRVQFAARGDDALFVAVRGRVALWTDGEDADQRYLQASAWLRREQERETAKRQREQRAPSGTENDRRNDEPEGGGKFADGSTNGIKADQAAGQDEPPREAPAAEPEAAEGQVENDDVLPPGDEILPGDQQTDGQRPAVPTNETAEKQKDAGIALPASRRLRPPSGDEPVTGLPALQWPAGWEDVRLNFALRPPFAPFDAPGWRFVQLPSPLPEAAYCAVGYRAEEDRVAEIAYAIPGRADAPPVSVLGYHFRPGRKGQGYWVTTRWA